MGRLYVFRLCAFVTAAEQNDHRISDLAEIHAVARTEIDLKLKDSFSNWLTLAQVARPGAGDSCPDLRAAFDISKRLQPFLEWTSTGLRLIEVCLSRSGLHS